MSTNLPPFAHTPQSSSASSHSTVATSTSTKREIYENQVHALLSWVIATFPYVSDAVIESLERNDNDDDSDPSTLAGRVRSFWHNNEIVVRCILRASVEIFDATSVDESLLSADDCWGMMANFAFDGDEDDDLDTSTEYIRANILRHLLRHTVSPSCTNRQQYVRTIMTLAQDLQKALMNLIEDKLEDPSEDHHGEASRSESKSTTSSGSRRSRSFSEDDDDKGDSPQRSKKQRAGPKEEDTETGETLSNTHTFAAASLREDFKELQEENERLVAALEETRKRESELEGEMHEIEAKHRARSCKLEREAIDKERELCSKFEGEITALKEQVVEMDKYRELAESSKKEVESLRDEVDVLQHAGKKLTKTEEQLRRCKERLEEMGDAKKALAMEEKAHENAISKCLQLEKEIDSLQPLRRQLEEQKRRADDAELRLNDCEDELHRLRQFSEQLDGQNKSLREGVISQQMETDEMRARLLDESTAGDGPGVGEGMSEMNPELMEELFRLRSENGVLREFKAKREVDEVQKLEEAKDDSQRLADRFKEQYNNTKQQLRETQQNLEDSTGREEKLRRDLDAVQEEKSDLERELERTKSAADAAAVEADRILSETTKSLNQQRIDELGSLEESLQSQLAQERTLSAEKLSSLEQQMHVEREDSAKALSNLRMESDAALKASEEDAESRITEIGAKHDSETARLEKAAEDERNCLVAEHNDEMTRVINAAENDRNTLIADHKAELSRIGNAAEDEKNALLAEHKAEMTRVWQAAEDEKNTLVADHQVEITQVCKTAEDEKNALVAEHKAEMTRVCDAAEDEKNALVADHEAEITRVSKAADDEKNVLVTEHEDEVRRVRKTAEDEKEALIADHKTEMTRVHQTAEDERNALVAEHKAEMTRVSENADDEKKKLVADHEAEMARVCQTAEDEKKTLVAGHEAEMTRVCKTAEDEKKTLTAEHEAEKARIGKEAEDDKNNLITKGKAMLRRVKTEAENKIRDMEAKCNAEMEKRDEEEAKRQKRHDAYAKDAQVRILSYKEDLDLARDEVAVLRKEKEELEDANDKLEREIRTLREEADRLRRMLGSRFGSDSGLQQQYETLLSKYKTIVAETRRLKQERKGTGLSAVGGLSVSRPVADTQVGWSTQSFSDSALSQFRSDYESRIDVLEDEKRELVMRNASLYADVQRADRRSWELEQKLGQCREEVTSLRLEVQRAEFKFSPSSSPTSSIGAVTDVKENEGSSNGKLQGVPREVDLSPAPTEVKLTELPHSNPRRAVLGENNAVHMGW